jgi:antitoxin component YwqK of YwqJK toxin-antitoxin module
MKNQPEYSISHKEYNRYNFIGTLLITISVALGVYSWVFDLDIENTQWLKGAFIFCLSGAIFSFGYLAGWNERNWLERENAFREAIRTIDVEDSNIYEDDLEQDGEITLYRGKRFTGVSVGKFKDQEADPDAHDKFEKHYKDGKMDGLYTVWTQIGYKAKEEYYKNGKMHGSRVCWFDGDRKMNEENYENDMREGLQVNYHYLHDAIWHKEYFKNDEKDGTSTSYYVNGKKEQEKHYKEGKENGVRTEWNEDGNKIYQGNFVQKIDYLDVGLGEKRSEEEGLHAEWHTNGKKKTEKHYKNGVENGIRKEWDENGKLLFEGNFVDGVQR